MAKRSDDPQPIHATRFQKGKSGNPRGRPRKTEPLVSSSYDTLLNLTSPANLDGKEQVINAELGLPFKTFNQAMAGNRAAQRKVLSMINEREAYVASKSNRRPKVELLREWGDPSNAYDALLLLDIASRDLQREGTTKMEPGEDQRHLWLEPWAVQLAIKKGKVRKSTPGDSQLPNRSIRSQETIVWPKRENYD